MPAKFRPTLCKHFYDTCYSWKFSNAVVVNISRIPEGERNGEGARNEVDLRKVCIGNVKIKYERIYKRQTGKIFKKARGREVYKHETDKKGKSE
jgi:hypothetical protein